MPNPMNASGNRQEHDDPLLVEYLGGDLFDNEEDELPTPPPPPPRGDARL